MAEVSTEHILKQIRTSFSIFCFVALNYCFLIHHTVATCTDKVRPSFNFRMECRNGLLYRHTLASLAQHMLFISFLSLQHLHRCFRGSLSCFTQFIMLLPIECLVMRFRGFHACHACSALLLPFQRLVMRFRGSHA